MRLVFVKVGIFIIALLSIFNCFRLFSKTGNEWLNTNSVDQVTKYEIRFEGVKAILPARGVIGYITEASPKEVMADGDLQAEYYLTQYAVAPVVVDNNPARNIVIGNFHSSAIPDMRSYGRFGITQNFDNGIILLRNEDIPS